MNITVEEKQAKERLARFEKEYGKAVIKKLHEMTDAFIAELESNKKAKKTLRTKKRKHD